ncbi:MAG: lysophospholipid acyltransferase family protein [Syntrophobacter sp.]
MPAAAAAALRLLHGTCRFTFIGMEYLESALSENNTVIAAFWHFAFPAVVYYFRDHNLLTIVSPSKDGEVAAGLVKGLGYTPFRGSPGKGGAKALRQFISALDRCRGGGFPVDGSQGPARIAQKGIPVLAMHARSPILPVSMAANPCWRLRSWDRTVIAKPFSRVVMAFGPLMRIERGVSHEQLEEYRIGLGRRLNALSDLAEKAVLA